MMVDGAYSGGSFGSAPTATSAARASSKKAILSAYADVVLAAMALVKNTGLTSIEVQSVKDLVIPAGLKMHQNYSGVFSNLSRLGEIVRIDEERDGHGVYVLPKYIWGRTVIPFTGVADGLRADNAILESENKALRKKIAKALKVMKNGGNTIYIEDIEKALS